MIIGRSAGLFQATNSRDVRMIQGREQFGLALEPPNPVGALRQFPRQHFYRNTPAELRVFRPVYLAHPALAELRCDFVVGKRFQRRGAIVTNPAFEVKNA